MVRIATIKVNKAVYQQQISQQKYIKQQNSKLHAIENSFTSYWNTPRTPRATQPYTFFRSSLQLYWFNSTVINQKNKYQRYSTNYLEEYRGIQVQHERNEKLYGEFNGSNQKDTGSTVWNKLGVVFNFEGRMLVIFWGKYLRRIS